MVEKAGHKTTMRNARLQWIDESKLKAAVAEDDEDYRIHRGSSGPRQPDKLAPIFENTARAAQERAKTPAADDLFGDEDIYNATPLRNTASTAPSRQVVDDAVPDDDDLDALMAEAEAGSGNRTQQASSAPFESIFGNGARTAAPAAAGEPDDDDLDALMAEAEAETHSAPARPSQPAARGSIFGDGKSKEQTTQQSVDEGDDLDALMAEAEAEAEAQAPSRSSAPGSKDAGSSTQRAAKDPNFDEDDLDALMAEAEAESDKRTASPARAETATASFEEDEEAMAEMDGLW
jgi:replication fork protection complex subunit Csm3/Swi3